MIGLFEWSNARRARTAGAREKQVTSRIAPTPFRGRMNKRILLGAMLFGVLRFPSLSCAQEAPKHDAPHWSYEGSTGPNNWGSLEDDFATCKLGQHQSPIDIGPAKKADLPPLQFHYLASPLTIIDNGHTVMVSYAPGSTMTVGDKAYELVQLHFHHPSEEHVKGKKFPMVAHLVHKDSEGHLAVVAILLSEGDSNSLIETLWINLPKEKEKTIKPSNVSVDATALLPGSRGYYTFTGSLTTPPCSENVTWYVLKETMHVSRLQVQAFAKLYPNDARPIQPLYDRVVLETK